MNNSPPPPSAYLSDTVAAYRALRSGDDSWVYPSVADLVAEHGVFYAPSPWLAGKHPARTGYCFAAAQEWAEQEGWTYVEGYVLSPSAMPFIVFDHAWCLTPAGQVADPALPNGLATHYFGVPYTDAFRREQTDRRGDALITFGHKPFLGVNSRVLRDGLPPGATLTTPKETP